MVSETTCDGETAAPLPSAARCPVPPFVRAGAADVCVPVDGVDEAALPCREAESFPGAVWPEPAGLIGGNNS